MVPKSCAFLFAKNCTLLLPDYSIVNNIDYINFPIADRDIPKEKRDTDELIGFLAAKTDNGHSIVIHCRMGIGRSTIIAASVLLKYGLKTTEIIEKISFIRGLKVPDTDEQLLWLVAREDKDQKNHPEAI